MNKEYIGCVKIELTSNSAVFNNKDSAENYIKTRFYKSGELPKEKHRHGDRYILKY